MSAPLPGPLAGLRAVELASEWSAFAGKLLADLGADVVLVEPPAGHHTRGYGPFLDDQPGIERSLWWWHYQTSKRGVTLDLDDARGREAFRDLIARADIVLEGDERNELARHGLGHAHLAALDRRLIWVSVTPFGQGSPRANEAATDLTLLAAGGPVWSCGYDDHELPPVRGGGNQALHTGGIHAVLATLVAVLERSASGLGQHIDVSLFAAANVTTEAATYEWLVAQQTVQRQTCRHASPYPTPSCLAPDRNGQLVHTGVPPRTVKEFAALIAWLDDLGLRNEFEPIVFLELGLERGGIRLTEIATDPVVGEIFRAGRDALIFLAGRTTAHEFFVAGQTRGIAVGVLNAPEDVMRDPHFEARGFHVPVRHEEPGRDVIYPGAPFLAPRSPWQIARRAPRLGEHNAEILGR